MNTSIQLSRCSVRYSNTTAWVLSDLSLSIPQGSCCAILGPTSSGKSTLLQALSGYLGKHHRNSESTGMYQIEGNEYNTIPQEILFPTVGMVLQDPYVMLSGMHETVREEIVFTLHNLEVIEGLHERANETLARLHISHLAERPPAALSGGEAQRVALASILVANPKVLLLDEPRNFLDSDGQERLARVIRSLHGTTTVLFTDYQVELALSVADSVLVLHEGQNIFLGTKQDLLKNYRQYESQLFPDDWSDLLEHTLSSPVTSHPQRLFQRLGLL